MNRRRFLAKVVAVVGGAVAVESMKNALAVTKRNGYDAVACNSCARDSSIYNKCVKCGKEMFPGHYYTARTCTGCGMNNEKRCAYCGNWIYDQIRHYARLCPDCYKQNICYKCGNLAYPDN